MSVTITIQGLDKIERMVDPARHEKAWSDALDQSAQVWRDETKKMPAVSGPRTGYEAKGIPVDTGRLRQSIYSKRISQFAAGIVAPVKYASHVEQGARGVPGRPFFEWSLELGAMKKIEDIFKRAISRII